MRDAFPRICGGETGKGRGYGDGASRFVRPNRSGGVVRGSSGSFGIRDSSWRGTLDSIKNVVAQSHIPPAFTILPQTCSSRGRRKTFPASPEKPGVKPCIRECTGIFRYVSKGRGLCSVNSFTAVQPAEPEVWQAGNSSAGRTTQDGGGLRRAAPAPPRGGTSVCSGPFSHLQISRPGKMRKARVPSPSLSFHQGFISSRSLLLRA